MIESPPFLLYPSPSLRLSPREVTRGFITKKCELLPPRAKRKENCPERSDVDFDIQRLEGWSEGESSPPRLEPQGGRGESQMNLARGPHGAPAPAAPKLPGDLSSPPSRCPNFSQPVESKFAAQVRVPRASSVPAPPSPYLPHAPRRASPGVRGPGRGPRKLPSLPRLAWGCSEAPALTWPKDSSGDQEAEYQTAGGGRLRCHIPPPPRGPPTESAPQEGASSPAPRCPRARGSGRSGQRLVPDTPPPGLWRCTFGCPLLATFHHAVPQLLLSPRQHPPLAPSAAPPGTGDPLFPGDT